MADHPAGQGEAITHAGESPADDEGGDDAAASDEGSAAATAGDATAGKQVFADNCSICHGADGLGGNGGPDLSVSPSAKDVTAVTKQVSDGGRGMPPFKGTLSDQQIADVTAYVTKDIAE